MLVVGRTRTGVMVEAGLARRGLAWCSERRVGFGVLLEEALPLLEPGDVRVEPGARQLVRFRVDTALWHRELDRWVAAPGVVCDSALRRFLPEPGAVPFELHS